MNIQDLLYSFIPHQNCVEIIYTMVKNLELFHYLRQWKWEAIDINSTFHLIFKKDLKLKLVRIQNYEISMKIFTN